MHNMLIELISKENQNYCYEYFVFEMKYKNVLYSNLSSVQLLLLRILDVSKEAIVKIKKKSRNDKTIFCFNIFNRVNFISY